MPSDNLIDADLFFSRAKRIFDAWEGSSADTEQLRKVDNILFLLGDSNDDVYSKVTSVQQFLLGYEFPSTVIVFHRKPRKITFVASKNKIQHVQALPPNSAIAVDAQLRGKDDSTAQVIPDLLLALGDSKLGVIAKEKPTGKLAEEWNQAFAAKKATVEEVDVTAAISAVMAELDSTSLKNLMTATRMTSTVMNNYFKAKIESIIDRGTKVTHEELVGMVQEKIGNDDKQPDMKLWNKNPSLGKIDFEAVEWASEPIVQSGGVYDIKLSAEADTKPLKPGVIIAGLGIKYSMMNSNMARTFFINPTKKQEQYYNILTGARDEALKVMKAGAVVRVVYQHIVDFVKRKDETLAGALAKSLGGTIGFELLDRTYTLNGKNDRHLREGMAFNLVIGAQGLVEGKEKPFAILISDTVKIGQEGAQVLTEGNSRGKDVFLDMGEEDDDVEEVEEKPKPKPKSNGTTNGTKEKEREKKKEPSRRPIPASGPAAAAKTRGGQRDQVEQTTTEKIKENQTRLHQQRQADGLKKWENGGQESGEREKQVKRYESYRREEQIPRGVEDRRIYIDEQRQTVLLPIYGFAVPFHISTIKNVTKAEEGDNIVLRVNFQSPGQIAGKKEDMPFENPDATFIRSASFRSSDARHMMRIFDSVTALKKAATKREAERKEMADVIEQEKLVEIKGRHPYVLKGVYPRPVPEGKKTDGNLEVHQNGIRFKPDGAAARIDVLFSNVKHLFFQPSTKELIVLIHVHLKAPIMIGKKKTYDVQFYREVSDMSFDETGGKKRRARYGDEDEIEQEQDERRRRQELDKEFSDFARRIEQAAQSQQYDLEVDLPFRELGFEGVPHRSNVLLMPTKDCLVHLSEFPPTVISLNDVEIVHLERVQFGLKNFDMVFVLNEFKKAPIHINSVPVVHLDNVKEWLDSCDVPISEGPVNLAWPAIMKQVNEDPYGFFEEGGWAFLTGSGEDSGASESEEGSEFEEESEGFDDEESDEDSESDFNDDDDSGSDAEEEDDSGEDWDEMEAKAKRADDKRVERGGSESDDGKSRKKSGRR